MPSPSFEREKRALLVSGFGNILLAIVGLAAAAVSSSQAILLDGVFNLTYFATALFTVKVASLVAGGDDERFPHGYAFFEPLINGIKGMLVLGVSVMALLGAVQALLTGGRAIGLGVAIAYGVFASISCWCFAYVTHRAAKATNSPLVTADAENWVVNAMISSGLVLAFLGVLVANSLGLDRVALYVDPVVVLTVVVISIAVPVRMAKNALMALLNRAPDGDVVKQVEGIVDNGLTDLPVQERFIRVIQPGRQRMVLVHAVLPAEFRPDGVSALDAVRLRTHEALCEAHVATIVDILFTADRRWGAPISEGGIGGATPAE